MNKERLLILDSYIKTNIMPILLENIPIDTNTFENAIIIEANCDVSLLNGHYEDINFVAPTWYQELIKIKDKPILIINNLNQIPNNDQSKFIEILKYRKISTFDLPKNCLIIVTATNLKEKPLNEEVYSLLAHI